MKSKREEYFENLYRIWGVGPSVQEKLAFWDKFEGQPISEPPGVNEEGSLQMSEISHLDLDIEDEAIPTEREIRVDKWCMDNGVNSEPSQMFRYFRVHYPHLVPAGETDREKLEYYQNTIIFLTDHKEVMKAQAPQE